MVTKNQQEMFLAVFLCMFFLGQGCAGNPTTIPSPEPPDVTITATLATTRTPRPTVAVTSTPDEVATLHAIETASVKTLISTVQPEVLAEYPSPDGKWRVEVIRYDCINYTNQDYKAIIAYEQLKLENLSDGTEKMIEDQLQNCDGVGGGGLKGLYWSPNNRYFYYTDWREGSPEGCGGYIVPAVYRFDTLAQESLTISGGHISPDKTKLVMWDWPENEIVIWDLDRGEVGRVQGWANDMLHGEIVWSPDGQSLIYLQTEFDCAPDFGMTYAIRLDLADMRQRLLLRAHPPGYGSISWDGDDQLTLTDGQGHQWNFDLRSRETGPVRLVTPVPAGIFALIFYPPLVLQYDTSVWRDASEYTNSDFMVNYLQSRSLESCLIGVQGPTDFNGTPPIFVPVQLGQIKFSVIFWGETQDRETSAWYIENQSLEEYDYVPGLPILVINASSAEWNQCQALAEKVLATLRVP